MNISESLCEYIRIVGNILEPTKHSKHCYNTSYCNILACGVVALGNNGLLVPAAEAVSADGITGVVACRAVPGVIAADDTGDIL